MRFLTTLFWVLVAVLLTYFATRNWASVTINLWGDIQASIKLPLALLIAFLLGLLPMWLRMRARLWSADRRIEALERQHHEPVVASPHPAASASPLADEQLP
jgi:putative membrane protein